MERSIGPDWGKGCRASVPPPRVPLSLLFHAFTNQGAPGASTLGFRESSLHNPKPNLFSHSQKPHEFFTLQIVFFYYVSSLKADYYVFHSYHFWSEFGVECPCSCKSHSSHLPDHGMVLNIWGEWYKIHNPPRHKPHLPLQTKLTYRYSVQYYVSIKYSLKICKTNFSYFHIMKRDDL